MSNRTSNVDANSANRRRRYIVDSAFQWKFSLTTAFAVLVIASILSIAQFSILHEQARLRAVSPASSVANVSSIIFFFGLGFAALTACSVCIWSIVFTHRICGPLLVLEKYLVELGENRIPHIRPLRKKDELKELFATLATSMDNLRAQRMREKETMTAAMLKLEALASSGDKEQRQNLEKAKVDLEQLCQEIAISCGNNSTTEASGRQNDLMSHESTTVA